MSKKLSKKRLYNDERKTQDQWSKKDFEAEKLLEETYRASVKRMQGQIDDFYLRYATDSGLSRLEAHKTIKNFDVPAWADKAAKAVADKDFSPETNRWLKTYNAKMRISRVELLKAEIELELIKLSQEENALLNQHGIDIAMDELKRQAGILGNSASGSPQRIQGVVNADFYGATFSDRIWKDGEAMRGEIFKSLNRIYTDMTGYREERNRLMQKFNSHEYEAMRLLKTESARIRSDAELIAYKDHNATHYIYVAEEGACEVCAKLNGKAIKIKDGEIGISMPPLHPNCRCSTYGHIIMEYKDGTTTLEEFEIIEDYDDWYKNNIAS